MSPTQKLIEAALADAFREGYVSRSTYNDTDLSSPEEQWEANKASLIREHVAKIEAAVRGLREAQAEPVLTVGGKPGDAKFGKVFVGPPAFTETVCLPAGTKLYTTPPTTDAPAQWQPIETAPRGSGEDGPRNVTHPDYVKPPKLLLWAQEGMVVGYYDWYYHPGYGRGAEPGVSAWRDASGGEVYGPTHWMPLHAAPTQEGAPK